jgi:RecB family exonuclease
VITARRTRLVRVQDLHEFRRVIETLCRSFRPSGIGGETPSAAPPIEPLVVVPTRSAGRQLQTVLGDVPAELVTRDELYDALHARLANPPRRLTAFEQEAIAQAAAAAAVQQVPGISFQLRPGLVAEMLRFYDQLRRQSQQVARFEELIVDMLGGESATEDRGVERQLVETRFLAFAFREYERRVLACHACDEHLLRARLISEPAEAPMPHVVVTVADWIADPDGLFAADFDLLARLPGLEALDIVATDATLASGFDERLHDRWPGLEDVRGPGPSEEGRKPGPLGPGLYPSLLTPAETSPDRLYFTERDREEELHAAAQRFARLAADPNRSAIVFKHPLPYLYLAPEALSAYQSSDALPLAAEPTAAAVDLVLELVETGFVRSAIVALLRSPHFKLETGNSKLENEDDAISRKAVSALDAALSKARYLGELPRLEALASEWDTNRKDAMPALQAAVSVCRELAVLLEPAPASRQIGILQNFLSTHLRPVDDSSPNAARERRARAAIANVLEALGSAHLAHHDAFWTVTDLSAAVRRWVGEETFVPEWTLGGVQLLDDQAARYGSFDHIAIVGLVEQEWPDRPRPNIFYPAAMLRSLGWPSERDRRGAADARFLDLLRSARATVSVSTFTLDDDTIVLRSTQLDEIPRARLAAGQSGSAPECGSTQRLELERMRGLTPIDPIDSPAFHGSIGPRRARPWSVSAIETYLGCPFRFYALHVLHLDEEPEDEEVMDPRRQGQLVHKVFEEFFGTWQAAGHGAITTANLGAARAMFEEVVNRCLAGLSEAEAGLERTRLLGSPAAAGLGDAVFRMEAERPAPVVERLLERRLDGDVSIDTGDKPPRVIPILGKADRVDLLEDGTFRLIDYKLGWPPNRSRALQLPVYALRAEQVLSNHRGRSWTLGEAAYLAFKGPKRVVPLFTSPADRDKVLRDAQARLVDAIDAIERGEFPPSPDDVYRCETCSVSSVCRKDYVGDVRT